MVSFRECLAGGDGGALPVAKNAATRAFSRRGFSPHITQAKQKTTQWVVFVWLVFRGDRIRCGKAHRLGEISSFENAKHFLLLKISHVEADQQSVLRTVCPPRGAPPNGCAAQSANNPQAKRRIPPSPPQKSIQADALLI